MLMSNRGRCQSFDNAALTVTRRGSETGYGVSLEAWAQVMGIGAEELPDHRDWVQVLPAVITVLEWLEQRDGDTRSEYLRSAGALDILDEIAPPLTFAGVSVSRAGSPEMQLERVAEGTLAALGPASS